MRSPLGGLKPVSVAISKIALYISFFLMADGKGPQRAQPKKTGEDDIQNVLNPSVLQGVAKDESPGSGSSTSSGRGITPNPIHPEAVLRVEASTPVHPNSYLLRHTDKVLEVLQPLRVVVAHDAVSQAWSTQDPRPNFGPLDASNPVPIPTISDPTSSARKRKRHENVSESQKSDTSDYSGSTQQDTKNSSTPNYVSAGHSGYDDANQAVAKRSAVRDNQSVSWEDRFANLLQFREENGHCLVPLSYDEKCPGLNKWMKRQRYQWKLKKAGRASTLTDEREGKLSEIGFVWDSHRLAWEERFQDLIAFKQQNGHCNVPSSHENHKLSVWVQVSHVDSPSLLGFVIKPQYVISRCRASDDNTNYWKKA